MITTTELIKLLQDNEIGGISHRPRKISLTVNGRYLPEPKITISSTGDGILGPEIDLDVDGEWMESEADEVLDKIRAEIEKIAKPNEVGGRGYKKSIRYGLCIALEIIDKCKTESEGEK